MDTSLPWIAIVDDDEAIRRALLRLMRSAGIPAQAYAGGEALLAAIPLAALPPCCVVLDVHMPGLSGLEVQERLAAIAPATGVIIMTGHGTPEEQARAMRLRPLAYLPKPVNDQLLLDAIGTACPSPLPPVI
ncbi:MAG: response regulator [Pseudomonadota bacterium]